MTTQGDYMCKPVSEGDQPLTEKLPQAWTMPDAWNLATWEAGSVQVLKGVQKQRLPSDVLQTYLQ